jgi:hypothetical protein
MASAFDKCFDAAKEMLPNFDEHFPHWKGRDLHAGWRGDGSGDGGNEARAMNLARRNPKFSGFIRVLARTSDHHHPTIIQRSTGPAARSFLSSQWPSMNPNHLP